MDLVTEIDFENDYSDLPRGTRSPGSRATEETVTLEERSELIANPNFNRGWPTNPTRRPLSSCWRADFSRGEPRRTRTYNQLIKSQLLCQLS